jgi:hypothetical protein
MEEISFLLSKAAFPPTLGYVSWPLKTSFSLTLFPVFSIPFSFYSFLSAGKVV